MGRSVAKIRKLEIANFRGIGSLIWHPTPGLNYLIGSVNGGKSGVRRKDIATQAYDTE
jgi:hypothetical protein